MATSSGKGQSSTVKSNQAVAFSWEEIEKEIQQARLMSRTPFVATAEQIKFIKTCRKVEPKVSVERMCILWKRFGWRPLGERQMRRYCNIYEQ